jgi:hypothetical protein
LHKFDFIYKLQYRKSAQERSMSEDAERWEPLGPKDMVFEMGYPDEKVTPAGIRGQAMFGARVRQRDGAWMKQMSPLQIIAGETIHAMTAEKNFTFLSNLK